LIHGIKTSGWIVGRVLSWLSREQWDHVPWRRVVAQNGQIVAHKLGERWTIQEEKLIAEWVVIDNHCVKKDFFWVWDGVP
jgi:alkylated DNA nucleotide flippase Atl1